MQSMFQNAIEAAFERMGEFPLSRNLSVAAQHFTAASSAAGYLGELVACEKELLQQPNNHKLKHDRDVAKANYHAALIGGEALFFRLPTNWQAVFALDPMNEMVRESEALGLYQTKPVQSKVVPIRPAAE